MAPVIASTDHHHLMMASKDSLSRQEQVSRRPNDPGIQFRETGEVAPEIALTFAKSWDHFIAGGLVAFRPR